MDALRRLIGAACKDVAGFIARQVLAIGILYFGARYVWRRMARVATEPARSLRATYEEARRELAARGSQVP